MRAPCALLLGAIVALVPAATSRLTAQTGAAVPVRASFAPRTALTVSARVLQFHVVSASEPAIAVVEFAARARTASDGEVLLSVERRQAIAGPGGAADTETTLSFTGDGSGTLGGELDRPAAAIAGRWTGSGDRRGRLIFSLRAAAPGSYRVPLEFVISTP